MARRRSFAIARRAPARRRSGPSSALVKTRKQLTSARKRASNLRKQYASPAGAMKTGLTVVAGGAAGGAANSVFGGTEIMGAGADAILAAVLIGVGVSSKKAWPIHMASGIAASYAAEWGEQFAADLMAGEGPLEALGLAGGQ